MKRMLLGVACALGLGAGTPAMASSSGPEAPIEGFGNDIPLSMAVKQIVPQGHSINFGRGVNQDSKVSWRGGSDWRTVLDNMVRSRNLTVSYAGADVRIADANAAYEGPVAPSAVASAPYSSSPVAAQRGGGLVVLPYNKQAPAPAPVAVAMPVVEATVVEAAPAPPPPPVVVAEVHPVNPPTPVATPVSSPEKPMSAADRRRASQAASAQATAAARQPAVFDGRTWRARQGQTLDQVLADWADKSGWTVVFSSKMIYELQANADFEGDFIEASTSLVKSVRANPRPIATFWRGNKVVVVSNSDQTN